MKNEEIRDAYMVCIAIKMHNVDYYYYRSFSISTFHISTHKNNIFNDLICVCSSLTSGRCANVDGFIHVQPIRY